MSKWRKNEGCLSVLLNPLINEVGIGVAFDENFMCHITTMLGINETIKSKKEIINKVVRF